jgi:hypothetical protein
MKLLIVFIATLNSFACFSQSSTKTDTASLLIHKWELIKTSIGGEVVFPSNGRSFFVFNKDGKYQMLLNEEEFMVGSWKLDTRKKTITTTDEDGVNEWTITKLTSSELILSGVVEEDKIVMYLKKIK